MFSSNINSYSRNRAVEYARGYALGKNPSYRYFASYGDGGGDCTNFVSQCLRAGGAPMGYGSPYPWWYRGGGSRGTSQHTWSLSWSVAHSLYWCLKKRANVKMVGLKGFEVLDIGLLELGDLIQYEDSRGVIYHSAIVTNFTYDRGERVPLISQHSYDMLDITHVKPKAKKMHFMKIVI